MVLPDEGPLSNPGPQLYEMAQLLSATPEWREVLSAMESAYQCDPDSESVIAAGLVKLREVGLGGEPLTDMMPSHYRAMVGEAELAAVIEGIEYFLVASAASEIGTGKPLPLPAFAGGYVKPEIVEQGGMTIAAVTAYVTELGDPEEIAARFLVTCYRTFGAETFAKRPMSARDAEWWNRHRQDASYRGIALSDPRSGLAPEVAANPDEYTDEVNDATDVVRRAVRRFEKRWTQRLDSVSKEDPPTR